MVLRQLRLRRRGGRERTRWCRESEGSDRGPLRQKLQVQKPARERCGDEGDEMKVFVGMIRHRHGHELYAAASREALYRQVHEYVRNSWDELLEAAIQSVTEEEIPETCLENAAEAVDLYFEVMKQTYG